MAITAADARKARSAVADRPVTERAARHVSGLLMLAVCLVVLAAGSLLAVFAVSRHGGTADALTALSSVLLAAGVWSLWGFIAVAPGHARVVQLFGNYRGTIREPGLQWVNAFTKRFVVSTRIRNQESAQVKVNDADGNPIEIAAVVVWQVQDTARAAYGVDDYVKFVSFQTETAIRHIASSYPYDSRGTDTPSLLANVDQITEQLSAELRNRVAAAGVEIIESRLTRLSYAPEIAQ